jgi:hypothetical protein
VRVRRARDRLSRLGVVVSDCRGGAWPWEYANGAAAQSRVEMAATRDAPEVERAAIGVVQAMPAVAWVARGRRASVTMSTRARRTAGRSRR